MKWKSNLPNSTLFTVLGEKNSWVRIVVEINSYFKPYFKSGWSILAAGFFSSPKARFFCFFSVLKAKEALAFFTKSWGIFCFFHLAKEALADPLCRFILLERPTNEFVCSQPLFPPQTLSPLFCRKSFLLENTHRFRFIQTLWIYLKIFTFNLLGGKGFWLTF